MINFSRRGGRAVAMTFIQRLGFEIGVYRPSIRGINPLQMSLN